MQGLGQALAFSYAKNCVSGAAQGLTHWWGLRAHWGPREAGGKAVGEEPGHWVPFCRSQGKEVVLQGVEQGVLLGQGAASVQALEATVSPCCRLGLCCCAETKR